MGEGESIEERLFREVDARMGAMHGYESMAQPDGGTLAQACVTCGVQWVDPVGYRTVHVCQHPSMQIATREDVLRLEAKLDALILALKAGAVGAWGNRSNGLSAACRANQHAACEVPGCVCACHGGAR